MQPQAEYQYSRRVFDRFTGSLSQSSPPADQLFTPFFVLKRYCGQMSRDDTGLHLFALICERLGQTDLAAEMLSRVITILEKVYDETEDAETEKRFSTGNVNLGRLRLATGDYAGAIEAFGITLALVPADVEGDGPGGGKLLRAQAHLGTGLANFYLDRLEDALTVFETALEEVPAGLEEVKGHITILLAQTLWAIGSDEAREAAKTQLLDW